ncbi:MAG TPA: IS21 family transposase [Solirubrobacteraceae bacterium]|nr:IS21 family transposase [Solirubrobacteraceae bacterium]
MALRRRGWSVSAIARHTGRDRKTIRAWLAAGEQRRRPRAPSVLEPYRAYIERRLSDDPHLDATVLLRELRLLGFDRSYQTLTRELRRLALRPECPVCKGGGHRLTIELAHEPGEELQLDWLELTETPWDAPCYVLVGALSHSGRIRAVVSDGMDFAHLVGCLDGVLRRLGGTARSWRTDRMATIVVPGSDRLRPEAAELAKHYAVTVAVCPPRRAQRKGVVEASIRYLGRSWWRTAQVRDPVEAQRSLDRWCVEVADERRRGPLTVAQKAAAEPLLPLPATAYPAELLVERVVSSSALVSFEGNRYSVPPALAGQTVTVRVRVGEPTLQIVSAAGAMVATHRRVPAGAGQLVRSHAHGAALEQAVLAAFTTRPRCARKPNRPPSAEALVLATAHGAAVDVEIPSLDDYARLVAAS